jgi:hypothetical protein
MAIGDAIDIDYNRYTNTFGNSSNRSRDAAMESFGDAHKPGPLSGVCARVVEHDGSHLALVDNKLAQIVIKLRSVCE